MAPTATEKKFKKVRLHKVAKELNLAMDTIVSYLEEHGHKGALSGKGVNVALTEEEAYLDLYEHFAEDREIRARVQDLRAQREAVFATSEDEEEVSEVAEQSTDAVSGTVQEPESEPDVPSATKPEEPGDPAQAGSPEPVSEPESEGEEQETAPDTSIEPGQEIAPESDPATVEAEETAESEAEEEPQAKDDSLESSEEVIIPAAEEKEAEDVEQQDTEEDKEASTLLPEPEQHAEGIESGGDDVISADRYQLQGTKVIGKIDLKTLEEDAEPGIKRRRKRKRKRKKVAAPDSETAAKSEDKPAEQTDPAKRKRRRRSKVDSQEVGQSVQETLRSLDQGTARMRQRRRRARRQQREEERRNTKMQQKEKDQTIRVTEFVSTGELADLMGIPVTDVISMLLSSGMMVSINQRLDADTIAYVADEFQFTVEFITEFGSEDIEVIEDDPEDLTPRAPVVTVMGHVDHGKTSLLDYVRNASVAAGESGGITQHIGAYKVALEDNRIVTFLDTPGHEAFTAMRARGAKVTDVVILVVAANDSVMPQTVEAINHSKAAGVPLIIAINKIDLEQADTQRVMKELSDHGVLVEQYGGKVQCAFVSAKTGEGIDDLLEKVLLEADLMELKGNPQRFANGIVIESRLDRGRGNVATVLVQNGTLKVGDAFVAGIYGGRVRAMFDEWDQQIKSVGPSEPALVLGLPGQPTVGDQLAGIEDESEAREIAQRRQQIWREQKMRQYKHVRLEDIGRRMALGDFNELNLIIKADVGGSVEAISDSLHKISTDEVAVNIIHSGVGAITESDVMLASASDAVIIGFQVRPTAGASAASEREEIDIRTYSIIYDAIEDVRDALEGLLTPEETEKITGVAEVREVFKVPKIGSVAGCHISEGRIRRSDTVHVLREGIVIYNGRLSSLRRFKDDVREVVTGYECGIGVENYNDIQVGDQIEAFETIQTKRTLEV